MTFFLILSITLFILVLAIAVYSLFTMNDYEEEDFDWYNYQDREEDGL